MEKLSIATFKITPKLSIDKRIGGRLQDNNKRRGTVQGEEGLFGHLNTEMHHKEQDVLQSGT